MEKVIRIILQRRPAPMVRVDVAENVPAFWNDFDELPVFVLRGLTSGHHPVHTHDFIEVVLVESGTGYYYDGTSESQVEPGNAFIVPLGGYHGIRDAKELKMINIQFIPERLNRIFTDMYLSQEFVRILSAEGTTSPVALRRFPLSHDAFALAVYLVELMEYERSNINDNSALALSCSIVQLLSILSRFSERIISPVASDNRLLDSVLSYIDHHLAEPLDVAGLAQLAGMSPSTFARFFRKHLGQPPIDYVLRRRMNVAISYLMYDTMSITEVALATGFEDSSYFSRLFRKLNGVSPREFRKNHR